MAVITAAGNGNWSVGGTWNGGVAPSTGDTADANGFSITLDQDVTCDLLRNNASTGGAFVVPAATTRVINASLQSNKASVMMYVGVGQTLTVNVPEGGNISQENASTGRPIYMTGGTLNINGDLTPSTYNWPIELHNSGAVCNFTGDILSGSGTRAFYNYQGTLNVITDECIVNGDYILNCLTLGTSALNITGKVRTTGSAGRIYTYRGTTSWKDQVVSIGEDEELHLYCSDTGTLDISGLKILNRGNLVINTPGTLTIDSGTRIYNMTPKAQCSIIGVASDPGLRVVAAYQAA